MKLRAVARDCLFVNWALPLDSLSPPPAPLRYDPEADGTVLVTALLLRQQSLPVSHPQLQIRLSVLDGECMPSVLVRTILVPRWALLGAKCWVRRSAAGARFELPTAGGEAEKGAAWRVSGELGELRLSTSPCAAPDVDGRRLIDRLRRRSRGYVESAGGLRQLETTIAASQVVPLSAQCEELDLLESCVPLADDGDWPPLHSAWLCPQVSMVFDLGGILSAPLPRQVPAPG